MASEDTVLETEEEIVETGETLITTEDKTDDDADSPADASSEEESKEEKTDEEKEGVPETYEFKMPEGMELDEARAEAFSSVAKDAELTQGQADKVVDMYIKVQQETMEAQQKAWADVLADWQEQSKTDSEFGGAHFQASVANAKRALEVFGNDKLKEALNQSGMGNHPELIRMLNKVGAAAADDNFVFGKEHGEAMKRDPAEILFPNQGKS
jgi:hypothetical protein